ncbi:C4-dicarboxylate ABC transporter permease [Rhodobacter xanthinilyticus]|uniref:C4-dicarboxylate ABC transporter permease n=1 Tax=Rhodobacter xanthinilyticus TaxID=1850250 RepID=A0A1D9M841_9RHOB|nr:TRAP transporter large permease subunit [Rhodobacter xanthinilyticus]AOZ68034.1 C4-dicarboxylate ABC transporter permease [Rhodobacter xanthinilyticus]
MTVAALMFPALFALVLAGIPVAFSLAIVSAGAGLVAFGPNVFGQLYGSFYSAATNFILAAIPMFVLMGAILERSGIAERLFKVMQIWLGRLPGGLAVATIAMGAVFAAAAGVVGAVEVMIGMMAIPAMQRYRYNNSLIAGTICAGGSLGTMIPPSVIAVMYASLAQISVGELLAGIASPTEAAAVGALGALVVCVFYGRFSIGMLREALKITVRISAMILLIVAAGTMFMGTFAANGGSRLIRSAVESAGFGEVGVIVFFLVIVLLLGFVLDWTANVLICVPLFTPFVRQAGIDPVWFGTMVIIVIQTSYLTPPMASSIFYLKSIAPPDMTYGQMYRGVLPFIFLQLVTLAIVALFPAIATWLPDQIEGF